MPVKVGGQTWLAKQLGISQPRVSQLVKGADWPFGVGPFDLKQIAGIKTYLDARRSVANATAGALDEEPEQSDEKANDEAIKALTRNPERVARIKLVVERTAKLKLEREIVAGCYVRKEDVEKDSSAKVFSVRAKLQEIPLRASLIAHRPERECERILTDWVKEICDYYAGGGN